MKKFIDKILDFPRLIITIWIILWVILLLLLILKFCFSIWYPIVVDNESFINICNYIDEHKPLSFSIIAIFYTLNLIIGYLTCRGLKWFKHLYHLVLIILIGVGISITKQYNNVIGIILEIIIILIVPITLNIKYKQFNNKCLRILIPILFYTFLNLWQLTMLVARDTDGLLLTKLPFLISLVLQFDYYTFTTITWIGVSYMGAWGLGWFWSKDITVLRAEKEKELAKKNPDLKKVAKIDSKISELEGK